MYPNGYVALMSATSTQKRVSKVSLPDDRSILIERTFDAPRELVFKACTDPELRKKWWGLRSSKTIVSEFDLRVGGKWRTVFKAADGSQDAFHGEIREFKVPEKIVQTFVYEGFPDAMAIETSVLKEKDGKTHMTTTVLHQSKENRDGHLHSGMEGGMNETFDRLDELLKELQ